jgi:predicted ribosomally synthesized peptide with SipW-like signal peptide
LGGLGTIGIASAAAGAGTVAYFSDTETSSNNSVTAGTLDLTAEGSSGGSFNMAVDGLAPGETKELGYVQVRNSGSVDGYLDINITNIDDQENGVVDPEPPGDSGPVGELSQYLSFEVYRDNTPGNGTRNNNQNILSGPLVTGANEINTPMPAGTEIRLWFDVTMDSSATNHAQSDRTLITGEAELAQTTGQ